MDGSENQLVEQFGHVMAGGNLDAIVDMYADDARVVSYSDIARGHDQIRDLYRTSLAFHGTYEVVSIDQLRDADDLVMWDATVQTRAGLLLTTQIMLLDPSGKILHHVPGIRGYWGM
jgi:SnoaL-like domain